MEKGGGKFCGKIRDFFLIGKRFRGVFDAEQAAYQKEDYYWEGKGMVQNLKTGDIQKFLFQTIARKLPHCLEDALISFVVYLDSGPENIGVSLTAVHDKMYREAIDLSLEMMYKDAEMERQHYPIPAIFPAPLEGKVENGELVA